MRSLLQASLQRLYVLATQYLRQSRFLTLNVLRNLSEFVYVFVCLLENQTKR